jgi:lysophospholipase L1-like esterase
MADTSSGDLNIVALGDSITYSVNHATGWVTQLQSMFPDATITNAGVSGNTLSQMEVRMQSYTPEAGKENIMIIWGGTNDLLAGTDPAAAASELASLVSEAKSEGWVTWVVDALPRTDVSQTNIEQFDVDVYTTVAADRFIDMYSYFTSSLNSPVTSLYSSDDVHPGTTGDKLIASVMAADIESTVDSAGSLAFPGQKMATSVSSSGTGTSIVALAQYQSTLFAVSS